MERPAKRARTDTEPEQNAIQPPPPIWNDAPQAPRQETCTAPGPPMSRIPPDLVLALMGLDSESHLGILSYAAVTHPDVASMVTHLYGQKLAREAAEAAKVIDFSHYIEKAWHELAIKYDHLSSSKQYDRSFDAGEAVNRMLDAILDTVTMDSNYGTKLSAINTYREIFNCMLQSGGVIGKRIRNDGIYDWGSRLLKLTYKFSGDDTDAMLSSEEGWVEKWEQVHKEAESYGVEDELKIRQALDWIRTPADEGDEDDEEEEDDE
ncbi:hypothetical protein QBC44DRAFT_310585 [Cladorrhinum sp. PSN332]|nr:hypothetical protein QBC44DRAFT_310585 [Cladorrhinum sp. PSN332]